MARRSDLAQKPLDDLRHRKQQMGLAHTGNRHHHNDRPRSESYASSKYSAQSSREVSNKRSAEKRTSAEVSRKPSNSVQQRKQTLEVAKRDIVPVGGVRRSEQISDLSMAIALALIKNGAQINLEFFGGGKAHPGPLLQNGQANFTRNRNRHTTDGNLSLTNQLPYLSHVQIGKISHGAQNLNMILKAHLEGLIFDMDSTEIGRMLLKGARDLEDSLKVLVTLQESPDHTVGSHRNKAMLLKDNEENESSPEIERRMTLSTSRFSFDRILKFFVKIIKENKKGHIHQKKQFSSSYPVQQKSQQSSNKNPSNDSKQLIANKTKSFDPGSNHYPSFSRNGTQGTCSKYLGSNSNSTLTASFGNEQSTATNSRIIRESKKLVSKGKTEHGKERIPNVIAKLMGLEEIPLSKAELECETPAESIYKQGKCRILEIYEKPASLEYQQGEHQRNKSKIPQAYENVTRKEKSSLKSSQSAMVPKDCYETQLSNKKMELVNKKSRFIKEANATWRNQNLKEWQNIEDTLHKGRKTSIMHYPKTAPQSMNGKSDWKEVKDLEKEMFLKKKGKANKNSVLPAHNLKFANHTILQSSNQRSHMNFTVEPVKPVYGKETNRKSGMNSSKERKSSLLVKNLSKNTQPICFEKMVTRKPAALSRKTNSKDSSDKMINTESPKENQSKYLHNQQWQQKDSITRNGSTSYTKLYKETAKKYEEEKGTLIDTKHNSMHVTLQMMRSGQFPVSENRENKIATDKCEDVREIEKVDEIEGEQGPTLKQYITEPHEPKQTREVGPIEEMILTAHASNIDKVLQQGDDSTSNASVTQDSKVDFPKPMNEKIAPKGYANEPLKDKNQQDNQEKCLYNLTGSQTRGSTDSKQNNKYNKVKQHSQITTEDNSEDHLTDDERHLMDTLTSNQQFLNTSQAHFELQIPVNIKQDRKVCLDNESKLTLDCGQEVIRRKGKIGELMLQSPTRFSHRMLKVRSLQSLIKELNNDIKFLKFTIKTGESECDTAVHLHKIVEEDIKSTRPCVNCMWDLGWNGMIFAGLEMDEFVKETEKHIFKILLDELVIEGVEIFSSKSI